MADPNNPESETARKPAPWIVVRVNISGATDFYITQGRSHIAKVFGSSSVRKEERARLIAEAPAMRAELERLRTFVANTDEIDAILARIEGGGQ